MNTPRQRQTSVPRPVRRRSRWPPACPGPIDRAVQVHPERPIATAANREQLYGNVAKHVPLGEAEEPGRAVGDVVTPPVSPSARPRNSDSVPSVTMSGGNHEPCDQHPVQRAGPGPQPRPMCHDVGQHHRQARRRAHIIPNSTATARLTPAADRQVNSAGDDDRGEGNRQQPDLDAEPQDLEPVAQRDEVRAADRVEDG